MPVVYCDHYDLCSTERAEKSFVAEAVGRCSRSHEFGILRSRGRIPPIDTRHELLASGLKQSLANCSRSFLVTGHLIRHTSQIKIGSTVQALRTHEGNTQLMFLSLFSITSLGKRLESKVHYETITKCSDHLVRVCIREKKASSEIAIAERTEESEVTSREARQRKIKTLRFAYPPPPPPPAPMIMCLVPLFLAARLRQKSDAKISQKQIFTEKNLLTWSIA